MKTVGVLALQGSFFEHLCMLKKIGTVKAIQVKSRKELDMADDLILPGGESTMQGKLLYDFGLIDPLREKIAQGLPVWGTCAGAILLAKTIVGGEMPHLGTMDITVRRNAYGSQLNSFMTTAVLPEVSAKPLPLVFIRAPWIEQVGTQVQTLSVLDGHIIAARQKNMLATAFHPELTADERFHQYFINML
ncbi:MAG: Pyridoxal 5'-phosphate synthase subunit PdxT [Clostridium sp.]|jgi:pyridoxal 5'-phosphate synthase pdxT subunit